MLAIVFLSGMFVGNVLTLVAVWYEAHRRSRNAFLREMRDVELHDTDGMTERVPVHRLAEDRQRTGKLDPDVLQGLIDKSKK